MWVKFSTIYFDMLWIGAKNEIVGDKLLVKRVLSKLLLSINTVYKGWGMIPRHKHQIIICSMIWLHAKFNEAYFIWSQKQIGPQ